MWMLEDAARKSHDYGFWSQIGRQMGLIEDALLDPPVEHGHEFLHFRSPSEVPSALRAQGLAFYCRCGRHVHTVGQMDECQC